MPWSGFGIRDVGRSRTLLLLAVAAVGAACDEDDDPFAPGTPTISGVVYGDPEAWFPVSGAVVRIGDVVDTTGSDGAFELTDLEPGSATLHGSALGFEDYQRPVIVPTAGTVDRSFTLTWARLFEAGDFTAYMPNQYSTTAILLALGGPDTRGFAAGTPFGAPIEEVELSLQALGESFRTLARQRGLIVLGTSRAAMPDGPGSDDLLIDAIAEFAAMTGLPELTSAPLLVYGMSGGAPQASGFTARNPGRVVGLFLKVPAGVESLTSMEPSGVPGYFVQAEMDAFVDNEATADVYRDHRAGGAPWALGVEPGVPHHSLSPRQRDLTVHWLTAVVDLRLPFGTGPLQAIVESTGWLGDSATLEAAPFAEYAGDPRGASWFPTEATAEEWELFVRGGESQH